MPYDYRNGNKVIASVLAIRVVGRNSCEKISNEDIGNILLKIREIVESFSGTVVSAVNGDLLLVFHSNSPTEHHVLRAYSCYKKILTNVNRCSLRLRAYLNCVELYKSSDVYWGENLDNTQRDMSSINFSEFESIIFSFSAVELIGESLRFSEYEDRSGGSPKHFYKLAEKKERGSNNICIVGRASELGVMERAALDREHILISGPAGIGKTSLAEYFIREQDYETVKCSFMEGRQFNILRSIFDQIDRIVLTKVGRVAVSHAGEVRTLSLFLDDMDNAWINSMYTKEYLSRKEIIKGTRVLVKLISSLPEDSKICFLLDDLQWADEGVYDLIEEIHSKLRCVTIISTSRKLLNEKIPNGTQIILRTLSLEDTEKLIETILPEGGYLRGLGKKVFSLTSGNPFYIVETIRDVSRKIYNEEQGLVSLGDIGSSLKIKNLILFQLEGMSKPHREVIELCACYGGNIKVTDVSCIISCDKEATELILNDLVKSDFLSFSIAKGGYEFTHSLKESLVCEFMSPARRRNIHSKIVCYLCESDRPRAYPNMHLSIQLFKAGMWGKAYRYCLRDAKIYLRNVQPKLAEKMIRYCLACAQELSCFSDVRELRLKLLLSKANFMMGDIVGAKRYVEPFKSIFTNKELIKFPEIWNDALNELTFYYWIAADYDKTLEMIEYAEANFKEMVDDITGGALRIRRIGVLSDMGRIAESSELIELIIEGMSNQRVRQWKSVFPVEAVLYAMKARNISFNGTYNKFESCAKTAIKAMERTCNEQSKIFTLCYLASGYIHFSNFARAEALINEASSLMEDSCVYVLKSYILSIQGYCAAARGDANGIHKITAAIYNARREGRLCRVPLFYLYLIKSKILVSEKRGLKGLYSRAIKIARKQKEHWVAQELYKSAYDNGIYFDPKGKITVPQNANIIDFSLYKVAK